MRSVREILRLHFGNSGYGSRLIAEAAGCGKSMVNKTILAAKAVGLTDWASVEGLSEDALQKRLWPPIERKIDPSSHQRRPVPNWAAINEQLQRRDHQVTLQLLWTEYKAEQPGGYSYPRFAVLYKSWKNKLSLVMRQQHHGGEKAFVDYCDGLKVTDARTGKISKTQLFVGVLGASSYTFVLTTASQNIEDWIEAHRQMYAFFGGVPGITVPDNLRTGINKADRYEADLNTTYQDMATHYGTCIIPARVRKPRDKGKVEAGVLVAQRWILAVLRDRVFYSLFEINDAIAELLERLNNRPMKHMGKSRKELFEALDKPALKPLPQAPFELAMWKKVRLNIDYHICYDNHHYSAPSRLAKEELWVRATVWTIEIFHKGQRVASHTRSHKAYGMTTVKEHMPSSHRAHAEWTPSRIIAWAQAIGLQTGQLVEHGIANKPHPEQGYRSALGIIQLAKKYGSTRLEKACHKALLIQAPSYGTLKAMLKNRMEDVSLHIAPSTLSKQKDDEQIPCQTDLLAADNIRGKDYYH